MKKQLSLIVIILATMSLQAAPKNQNNKMAAPYKIMVTNNTGKDIKVELHYDRTQHRGEKDLILNAKSQPQKGQQGSVEVNYCVKKITVKEKKTPFNQAIVLEKQVNICDDTHFNVDLRDGKFSISPNFFSGWGWWSY